MSHTEPTPSSIELTKTAVRMLKASAMGASLNDTDLQVLRAAADAEDRELSSDQLACHIVLREIRLRRQAAMAAVNVPKAAGPQ